MDLYSCFSLWRGKKTTKKNNFPDALLIKLVMHFTAGCKAVEHAQGAHKHILEWGNIIYTAFILSISPQRLRLSLNYCKSTVCSPLYNFIFNWMRLTSMNIWLRNKPNEIILLLYTDLLKSWTYIAQQHTIKPVCGLQWSSLSRF